MQISPRQKKYALTGAFVLNFLFLIIAVAVIIKLVTTPYVSPNVLYLGQPLHAYTGFIKSINKDTIVISQDHKDNYTFYTVPGMAEPLAPTKAPQFTLPKELSYTVMFDKKTDVIIPLFPIPYHFKKTQTAGEAHGTISDLKEGDYVTVNTQADLRLLRKNEFTATIINVIKPNKFIRGPITAIENNTLKVQAIDDSNLYTVTLTPDTEISRFDITNLNAKGDATSIRVNKSDLQIGQIINAYSEKSIENFTLTASLIEPQDLSRVRNITPSPVPSQIAPSPTSRPAGQSLQIP